MIEVLQDSHARAPISCKCRPYMYVNMSEDLYEARDLCEAATADKEKSRTEIHYDVRHKCIQFPGGVLITFAFIIATK